ncbi:MAG: hypothetical protein ABW277_25430 [Longimicrobiaceae bacterium]|jgi:hypothetical protein
MSSRQPTAFAAASAFTPEQLGRIRNQAAILPRPRLVITDQIPPAGSIVPKGTVVQVVLTDVNNLTLEILQPDVPDAIKGVRVADAARVVEANPTLKAAVASNATIDAASVAQHLNTSGTGVFKSPIQAAEAVKAINTFRTFIR